MCGWDTDCNVGNVATIMGVRCGLEGIPQTLRRPINDILMLQESVNPLAGVEGGGEAGLVSVVIEVAGDVVGLFVEHMSYAHRRGDGDEQGAGGGLHCSGLCAQRNHWRDYHWWGDTSKQNGMERSLPCHVVAAQGTESGGLLRA